MALVLLAGCSAVVDIEVPYDAGAGDGGETEGARRLLPLGEPSRTVAVGRRERFEVTYMDETGAPLPGERVRFDLAGDALDSSLEAVDALTDGEGRAEVWLQAGARAARFRLRASAPRAAEVWFDVTVVDGGVGRLRVVLEPYRGARRIERVAVRLVSGGDCPPDGVAGSVIAETELAADEGEARFEAVPAGVPLHVVAEGLGALDEPVSAACAAEVRVAPEAEMQVRLALLDLPLRWVTRQAEVQVSAPEAPALLMDTVRPALERAVAARGGLAGALLEAVASDLERGGEVEDAATVRRLGSSSSTFPEALTAAWRASGGLLGLQATLGRRLRPLASLTLLADRLEVPDSDRLAHALRSVQDAEGEELYEAGDEGTLDVWPGPLDDERMPGVRLEASLPLGTLAVRRLGGIGPEARAEALGCGEVAGFAADYDGMPRGADEARWHAACVDLATDLVAEAVAALEGLDARAPMLRLEGEGEPAWRSGTVVERLEVPEASGGWGEYEASLVLPASGSLQLRVE